MRIAARKDSGEQSDRRLREGGLSSLQAWASYSVGVYLVYLVSDPIEVPVMYMFVCVLVRKDSIPWDSVLQIDSSQSTLGF